MTVLESLKNIGVMIELEVRRLRHDRMELWTRAVQPILWIAIYGTIMGNVRGIPTGGLDYKDYITPGVLIQSTTFVSIFYGLTIVWERESGILKRLLVSPVSRSATVIGRSMAAGVRAIFQGLIIIPIALIIGVRFIPNPLYLLGAFVVIFFAAGGFAAISIFIASFFKTRERFMGIGQAITFPLFFTSSALYPLSMMPHVLKEIALVNPVSYVVDAVRGLMISGDLSELPIDILAIAVFLVVMFSVASVSFKRIIE
jgi:ABC-2 type transport system permease protein